MKNLCIFIQICQIAVLSGGQKKSYLRRMCVFPLKSFHIEDVKCLIPWYRNCIKISIFCGQPPDRTILCVRNWPSRNKAQVVSGFDRVLTPDFCGPRHPQRVHRIDNIKNIGIRHMNISFEITATCSPAAPVIEKSCSVQVFTTDFPIVLKLFYHFIKCNPTNFCQICLFCIIIVMIIIIISTGNLRLFSFKICQTGIY